MKPYAGNYLEHQKRIFNYRLSRARRVSENTFGISTARWHIFKRLIIATLKRCISITKAVIALHNFLMLHETTVLRQEQVYCPPGYADFEDKNEVVVPGARRSDTANDTGIIAESQEEDIVMHA